MGLFHRPLSSAPLRVALTGAALVGLSCFAASARGQQENLQGKTCKQVFKNIKVIGDVPATELLPTMQRFNASLGVQCNFCHIVETDAGGRHVGFERDTKPEKGVARRMMAMTQDINAHQRVLDRKATCYMCHHGQASPVVRAPMPAGPGGPGGRRDGDRDRGGDRDRDRDR